MNMKKMITLLTGLIALQAASLGFAQQRLGFECSDCQVGFASEQDLVDAIVDIADVNPADVSIIPGNAPGVYRLNLTQGPQYIIEPVGLTFRHQNMVQRRLLVTDEGGLHLRLQSRAELRIRSAVHNQEAVVAQMLQQGWDNFYWLQHGMEVESPGGDRYCFRPDMEAFQGIGQAQITITQDTDDGSLVIIHPDGLQQRLHACAHDLVQLRDQVRLQVKQQMVFNPDGSIDIQVGSNTFRYRLNAELHWSGIMDAPGFVRDGDRLLIRYRDGWEQEIISLN